MTNILFRPTFRYNSNDGMDLSDEGTFDKDPYEHVANPLDEINTLISLGIVKNTRDQDNVSYSDSKNLGGMLQLNRKLSTTGRNITLQLNGNWGDGESRSISNSFVQFYQLAKDSSNLIRRYNFTPTKNWNYRARVTYSEPIFRQVYLQFIYQFRYDYTKSDRGTYDFSKSKIIPSPSSATTIRRATAAPTTSASPRSYRRLHGGSPTTAPGIRSCSPISPSNPISIAT